MTFIKHQTFICLDCETTGLDIKKDRIIEIAVAKFTLDVVLEQYETLINPQIEIPAASIAIHHITQEMVQEKPAIEEVLGTLIEFIGLNPIVGHGIGFDIDMVLSHAERAKLPCHLKKNLSFDTLRLARLYGESPSNSLETLRRHFNIQAEGAHRAMSDVIVNIQVFKHLASRFQTLKDLIQALAKPIQMKHMPLGKHKGRLIKEIPLEYLQWAARQEFDQDLLFSLRSEINRRKKGSSFCQVGNPFQSL